MTTDIAETPAPDLLAHADFHRTISWKLQRLKRLTIDRFNGKERECHRTSCGTGRFEPAPARHMAAYSSDFDLLFLVMFQRYCDRGAWDPGKNAAANAAKDRARQGSLSSGALRVLPRAALLPVTL